MDVKLPRSLNAELELRDGTHYVVFPPYNDVNQLKSLGKIKCSKAKKKVAKQLLPKVMSFEYL